jgi:hypothetical protein
MLSDLPPLQCDSCGRQTAFAALIVRETIEWDEQAEELRRVQRQERWCRSCYLA